MTVDTTAIPETSTVQHRGAPPAKCVRCGSWNTKRSGFTNQKIRKARYFCHDCQKRFEDAISSDDPVKRDSAKDIHPYFAVVVNQTAEDRYKQETEEMKRKAKEEAPMIKQAIESLLNEDIPNVVHHSWESAISTYLDSKFPDLKK